MAPESQRKRSCFVVPGGEANSERWSTQDKLQKEREDGKLQKEPEIKKRALAETVALLVLRKKARAIWEDGEDA